MIESKKQGKTNEEKFNKFKEEIQNEKKFLSKINQLFTDEYDGMLEEILLLNESKFLSELKYRVENALEEIYSDKIFFDKKYSNILEKSFTAMKSDYKQDYKLIINSYDNSKNFKKNDDIYLINGYRRHCPREVDNEHATHICDSYRGKFILCKDNNKIEFVVCSNCKKVYYSNMILCKCYKCNKEYYTEIFTNNEDEFNLPSTWENYHCKQITNEEMKCVKCRDKLYINLNSGMLNCQNKKCNFSSKPTKILWTCSVCQTDFKTGAIPYNPLDLEVVKKIIKETLSKKILARPNNVPCCKINVFLTEFHHKKKCAGILYFGQLNNDNIIVCENCHAINFADRFIWTCPKCGSKFNDEKNKKYEKENIEDKFNSGNNDLISYKTITSEGRKKGFSNSRDKISNNDDHSSSNSNTSKNKINQVNTINNKIRPFLSNRNKYYNYQYKTENKNNEENYSSTIEQPNYLKKLYASKFRSFNNDLNNNKEQEKEKDNSSKFKNDFKRQNDEKELMNKFKRIKFLTVNDFTNKNKERQKKAEIEKEIKNYNSYEENEKRNNQRSSFQTFANYRQRKKTEEKLKREEKEKEDLIKKRMKDREEKERKEREEKERKEREEREE